MRLDAKYNNLTVISEIHREIITTKFGNIRYSYMVKVRCDCGAEKNVNIHKLKSGSTKTCGCGIKDKLLKGIRKKHGLRGSKEYGVWNTMVNRCHNQNSTEYYGYGALGVTVCDRWRYSFANFISDMGRRPSDNHSIDRYPNSSGNYEPTNCRWATLIQQANNKRRTIYVTIGEETKALGIWCKDYSIPYYQVYWRIKHNWLPIDALTVPLDPNNRKRQSLPKNK